MTEAVGEYGRMGAGLAGRSAGDPGDHRDCQPKAVSGHDGYNVKDLCQEVPFVAGNVSSRDGLL